MFISYTGSNLNTFLTYTGLSQIEFAKKTDIDIIELYKVLESRMPISNEMVDKIAAKFPNVNKEWLLNGEGNMLLGDDDLLQDLRNELLGKYYTKLLPTSAVGGSLVGLQADGVFDYQCEKVVSPIPDIDFAMQVYGDSMSPVYPNGSRVFIKKVNPDIFIEYNRIYVLDTSTGVIIKKVMPSEKEGHIKCVSLNEEYLPFEVHMNEIHGWYKVLGCLTLSI